MTETTQIGTFRTLPIKADTGMGFFEYELWLDPELIRVSGSPNSYVRKKIGETLAMLCKTYDMPKEMWNFELEEAYANQLQLPSVIDFGTAGTGL